MKMLSELLGSTITRVLSILALLFLSTSLLMTKLYLDKRDDLTSLQSTYRQLQETSKELVESKYKIKISSEQDDQLILHKQLEIDKLSDQKSGLEKQLANIPKKTCKAPVVNPQSGKENEIQHVNIDAPFDDEYKRVFKQLGDKDKRSTDIYP